MILPSTSKGEALTPYVSVGFSVIAVQSRRPSRSNAATIPVVKKAQTR